MSQEKLYSQLIQSLTDNEFDKLVLTYLREVDDIKNVFNSNGPYDSGIDVRPIDVGQIEIQYQITTIKEKNFEAKLYSDLEKAQENVINYKLPSRVKYFYSYPLTNDSVFKYRREAKDKYQIVLDLIPGNVIAGITSQYEQLRVLLYNIADIETGTKGNDYFDDSKVKAFYDLMSFGTSTDIKYNIIKSYVLNYLYKEGPINSAELLKNINNHFSGKIADSYFEIFLSRLGTERKIFKNDKNEIVLTEEEKSRIKDVLEKYSLEETLLKKQLLEILSEYNAEGICDEIILKLAELYESNYSINLGEFTDKNTNINDLKTATHNFNEYLKDKISNHENSEFIAKRLFEVADRTEFLSRIAAGRVYTKVSNPDRLQDYITRHISNKDIFLDTNVILHAICVFYEPDAEYNKTQFKIAKQLLEFRQKYNLNFKTIRQYSSEIVSLFKDALAIIPFTKLPVFQQLGGTKNVLYNFFLHLKDWEMLHEGTNTFEEFLKEFRFEIRKQTPDYHFTPQINWLLNEMEIDIENPKQYDIVLSKQLIIQDQKANNKHKSSFAISNDAIMFRRLGDDDSAINPIDPIFCTWDMSLLRVRRLYFEEYPNCTEWLMYTPTRLMDHYSMMNFQVKQGTLSNEVLTILDEDFSFQERTHSLLDSMLTIINPNSEVGLQYTNKFAELRQKEIIQVDYKPESTSEDVAETNYLDVILRNLVVHYMQSEAGQFDSFKAIFTKKEFLDPVIDLLHSELNYITQHNTISSDLTSKMDELVERSKSTN